jgi:hypothetical protein
MITFVYRSARYLFYETNSFTILIDGIGFPNDRTFAICNNQSKIQCPKYFNEK